MRFRLTKMASLVSELDRISEELETENKKLALHIDTISDKIEKKAFYPMGWLPGRGLGPGPGMGRGRFEWFPGRRTPYMPIQEQSLFICPQCGMRIRKPYLCQMMTCPDCGIKMNKQF